MRMIALALLSAAVMAPVAATAGDDSPIGLWKNVDDATGKPKALIRISENRGTLQGRIEKLFPAPGGDPDPKCVKCEGVLKDQPILGMVFMSGLRKEDGNAYGGGKILDPDNGKVYRSRMTLIDGGNKLNVRGYIGIPVLGRSQVWIREE